MSDNGILSGCRVVLEIQRIGQTSPEVLGLLTDVTITDSVDWAAIKVIGSLPTAEFAPVDYSVTIDAGKFYRLPRKTSSSSSEASGGESSAGTLRQVGIFPKYGNSDVAFLQAAVEMSNGLLGRVRTIDGDVQLGRIIGMLPAQRVLRVQANSLVTNSLTFVARIFQDEE